MRSNIDMDAIRNRSQVLAKLVKELEEKIPKMPEGNLRMVRRKKSVQYFLVTETGDTHGQYIRKEQQGMVPGLAQRDYYDKLLREARREKQAIDSFIRGMRGTSPEDIYDKMSDMRRAVVTPILLSDEEYARRWMEESFQSNPYFPEDKVYETKRGEKVRTKSEAMLANMYYEMGIPYKYECPLKLKNGEIRYPDFTLLHVRERKLVYHEHLGLLEDPDYRRKNLSKISEYSRSGINLLDNLFLTYETEYEPLNVQNVKKMISGIFL